MIRWLRVVIAPTWLVLGLAIAWIPYISLATISWSLLKEPPDWEVRSIQLGTLGAAMAIYGIYRVVGFHPLARTGYRDWLARSPWTRDKPLPDGPVLLAAQDAVVFVLVGMPAYLLFGSAAWILFPAFSIAYLTALATSLIMTGMRGATYLIGVGVVAMVGLVHIRPAVAGLALITYVMAAVGLRWSFRYFPWMPDGPTTARELAQASLSWPLDRLSPVAARSTMRPWEGWAIGLLMGSVVLAVGYQLERAVPAQPGDRPSDLLMLSSLLPVVGASIRLLLYTRGYSSPISLLGRVATGRLIIPAYDVVFVGPLLAIIVAVAGPVLSLSTGMPGYVGTAVGVGFATGLLNVIGPDRTLWQLTAPARLVPVKRASKVGPPQPALVAGR